MQRWLHREAVVWGVILIAIYYWLQVEKTQLRNRNHTPSEIFGWCPPRPVQPPCPVLECRPPNLPPQGGQPLCQKHCPELLGIGGAECHSDGEHREPPFKLVFIIKHCKTDHLDKIRTMQYSIEAISESVHAKKQNIKNKNIFFSGKHK